MKRTKFHVRRVSLLILVLGLGSLVHSALMNAADSIPSHWWSKRFGDIATDRAQAVVTDASGNVLVVGSFQGTVDFGGGGLTSAGDSDMFVPKLGTPSGKRRAQVTST